MPRPRVRETVPAVVGPDRVTIAGCRTIVTHGREPAEALPDGLHPCPGCGAWLPDPGVELRQCPQCEVWFGTADHRRAYCSAVCRQGAARRRQRYEVGAG